MRTILSRAVPVARAGLSALFLSTAVAQAGGVSVSDAWIRALPAGVPAGGYFTLHNDTSRPIALVGASSPACGILLLHRTDNMAGMSGMSGMDGVSRIDVAPGGRLQFAPGGYHLMCIQPSSAVQPGKSVTVTLQFADGSRLVSRFVVYPATGR
jgi:copper(I)-binding protein